MPPIALAIHPRVQGSPLAPVGCPGGALVRSGRHSSCAIRGLAQRRGPEAAHERGDRDSRLPAGSRAGEGGEPAALGPLEREQAARTGHRCYRAGPRAGARYLAGLPRPERRPTADRFQTAMPPTPSRRLAYRWTPVGPSGAPGEEPGRCPGRTGAPAIRARSCACSVRYALRVIEPG
jgi:hypothetical protein